MTTTYLYIANISEESDIETVRKVLNELGIDPVSIVRGEVKIGWNSLSRQQMRAIKEKLHENGYELISVSQTIWQSKDEGVDIL